MKVFSKSQIETICVKTDEFVESPFLQKGNWPYNPSKKSPKVSTFYSCSSILSCPLRDTVLTAPLHTHCPDPRSAPSHLLWGGGLHYLLLVGFSFSSEALSGSGSHGLWDQFHGSLGLLCLQVFEKLLRRV